MHFYEDKDEKCGHHLTSRDLHRLLTLNSKFSLGHRLTCTGFGYLRPFLFLWTAKNNLDHDGKVFFSEEGEDVSSEVTGKWSTVQLAQKVGKELSKREN